MNGNMYLISWFKSKTKAIWIGLVLIGLFVVYSKTSIFEGVKMIQGDVLNIQMNDSISNKAYKIRKMAHIIDKHSPNFTSTAAMHDYKKDGGKEKPKAIHQQDREPAEINTHLTHLTQLIETNKKIYTNDSKKKQLSATFLRTLNGSFPKIKGRTYDNCKRLISEIKLRHKVKYFVFRYSYDPSPIDVTLLTHLTLNRGIHRIGKILAQWPGPASVSVFGTDKEVKKFLNTAHSWKRKNVGIHVVYQRNAIHYPVNFMRNVA
ncbi:unnamed protein product, partial [Owenia fusiformis]